MNYLPLSYWVARRLKMRRRMHAWKRINAKWARLPRRRPRIDYTSRTWLHSRFTRLGESPE